MELTRRDALVAAVGTGVGVGGGGVALSITRSEPEEEASGSASAAGAGRKKGVDRELLATFVAVARAIYPSTLTGIEEFVRTYVAEQLGTDGEKTESRRTATRETASELDELAASWHDTSVVDLDPGTVATLLREIGVDIAEPDPSGTIAQRLRFHVVNELHYALYTSPTGGRLVGIENPIGHPGGTASYQQGPST
ncbi:Tat (twin-arginine translocation) pathway signal sequence [Halobacteriales archaeon QS_3_64_16]|nr:MAG: Tat (twin-arginine translocation) pathway signal sequence [Halobacteriales archaeon QS_3_64_16]